MKLHATKEIVTALQEEFGLVQQVSWLARSTVPKKKEKSQEKNNSERGGKKRSKQENTMSTRATSAFFHTGVSLSMIFLLTGNINALYNFL